MRSCPQIGLSFLAHIWPLAGILAEVGRPRKLKVDAIRYRASRDGESKEFASHIEAMRFIAGAKRLPKIEETYWRVRGWELTVERYANEDQIGDEPLEELNGVRLVEKPFTLKGSNRDELVKVAEARREASYARNWHQLYPERMPALPPASRELAKRTVDVYFMSEDRRRVETADRKQIAEEKAAALAAEAAIPKIGDLFEQELKRKINLGSVQSNTADVYRYQANALKTPIIVGGAETLLWNVQVHRLDESLIEAWLAHYAAEPTRFGKPPSSKTLVNALQPLRDAAKALSRDPKHRQYGQPFGIINTLLEDIRSGRRDADGWRRRARLTLDEMDNVLNACSADEDWAIMGLLLAGPRPPSELVAVEWSHLERDEAGNLWWHVAASGIEHVGGEIEIRERTKTKDVDYRQLSVCRRTVPWIETLRGRSKYILGSRDGERDVPIRPTDLVEQIETLLSRAGVLRPGISAYSFRHTVGDEVERLLGRTARDLVLHGKRDRTTGGIHYSHAERDRRRAELTFEGMPFGEHMAWSKD